uniref:hypothetical protein n=1 Tax=Hafnia alvei TaxID=569 RepID=UPI00266D7386|nr:hypothetical protein [Hafnia alvei]
MMLTPTPLAPSAPETECHCYLCGKSKEAAAMIGKLIKVGQHQQYQKFCDDHCHAEWKLYCAPKVQVSRTPARRYSSWELR